MSEPVKDIDGSVLEGGGQILRMALAFSVLKQLPIRVFSIRAGRSSPGLRPQHLKGVEIVRDISGGKLKGGEIGSTEIVLHPGKVKCGEYLADTGTAGSICLLIQVALPCILFSNGITTLKLRGGTNAEMAPQIDYTTEIFRPLLERFGGTFDYRIISRGYYPRGGGEVHIRVKPVTELKAVTLTESGHVVRVWGWAFVAGSLPIKVAHLMADSAVQTLSKTLKNVDMKIERYKEDPGVAVGNGSGINIIAETSTGCLLGGSALGKRELKAEEVGRKAADELLQSINTRACVDSYAQDQMILLMAVAHGKSRLKCGPVTLHTQTAIHIAHQLTEAKFTVIKDGPDSNIIECEGIGLKNSA